jgi:hypothetical protein
MSGWRAGFPTCPGVGMRMTGWCIAETRRRRGPFGKHWRLTWRSAAWNCIQRRRRSSAEATAPGAVFAAVARRHEISPSLLWDWRRDARARSDAVEPDGLYFSALVNGSSRRIHATTWGNGPNEGGRKPKPAAPSVECASMRSRKGSPPSITFARTDVVPIPILLQSTTAFIVSTRLLLPG